MTEIVVARDFSLTPGGRFKRLGPYSGEEFRALIERFLQQSREPVQVILDGAEGYGSSFLEEAFGGLVRSGKFKKDELRRRVEIVARDPLYRTYAEEAKAYLDDAIRAVSAER